ncbi:MAG: TIGR00266 family protein [Actinobacteria bacterium]|nr:MAG: TIGR00266 family protein [Actinomycetota bacterium]
MNVEIRHAPSFAVARAILQPGEAIRAESGAMMATSQGVDIEARARGGMIKSLKRSVLGGESFFVTTYTAPQQGGWVDCAARLPGDCIVVDVDGALNISRGSYLCSAAGVEIDTRWGGFKNLFGGEGGFLVHATGHGQVVLSCYGALDVLDLSAGESLVLDSGHMVAYSEGTQYQLRKVAGGVIQSLKSGEGLVFEFTGPGRVWMQSRNPNEFISWLTDVLPFTRE